MLRVTKRLFLASSVFLLVWLGFSWFEAGTEIRILCSQFHPGLERQQVVEVLETGEYLRYQSDGGPDDPISIDSYYNLLSKRCVVEFGNHRVVSSNYR